MNKCTEASDDCQVQKDCTEDIHKCADTNTGKCAEEIKCTDQCSSNTEMCITEKDACASKVRKCSVSEKSDCISDGRRDFRTDGGRDVCRSRSDDDDGGDDDTGDERLADVDGYSTCSESLNDCLADRSCSLTTLSSVEDERTFSPDSEKKSVLTANAEVDCEPAPSSDTLVTSTVCDTVSVDNEDCVTIHPLPCPVSVVKHSCSDAIRMDATALSTTVLHVKRIPAPHLYRLFSKHVVDAPVQTTDTEDDDYRKKREKSHKWSSSDDSTAGGHAPSAWTYQRVSASSSKASIQKISTGSCAVSCSPQLSSSEQVLRRSEESQSPSVARRNEAKHYKAISTSPTTTPKIVSSNPNTPRVALDAFTFLDDRVFSIPASIGGGQAKTRSVSPHCGDILEHGSTTCALDPTKYQLNNLRQTGISAISKNQSSSTVVAAPTSNSDVYTFKCYSPSRAPKRVNNSPVKSPTTPVDDVFDAVRCYRTSSASANSPNFVLRDNFSGSSRHGETKEPSTVATKLCGNVPISHQNYDEETSDANLKSKSDVSELYTFRISSSANSLIGQLHPNGLRQSSPTKFQENLNLSKPYDALIAEVESVQKSFSEISASAIPMTFDRGPDDSKKKTETVSVKHSELDKTKKLVKPTMSSSNNTVSAKQLESSFATVDMRLLSNAAPRYLDSTIPKNASASLKLRTADRSLSQWTFTVDTPVKGVGTTPHAGKFVDNQHKLNVNNVTSQSGQTDSVRYLALPNRPSLSIVTKVPCSSSSYVRDEKERTEKSDWISASRNDCRKQTSPRHSYELQFLKPSVHQQTHSPVTQHAQPFVSQKASPSVNQQVLLMSNTVSQQFLSRDNALSHSQNQNVAAEKPTGNVFKNVSSESVRPVLRHSRRLDSGNRISTYDNVGLAPSSSRRQAASSRTTVVSSDTRYSLPWDSRDIIDFVQPVHQNSIDRRMQGATTLIRAPAVSCVPTSSATVRAQSTSRCGVNRSSGVILSEADITTLHRSCFELKSGTRVGPTSSVAPGPARNLTTGRKGPSPTQVDSELFPLTTMPREKMREISNGQHLFVKENDNFRFSFAESDRPDSEYFGTNDCLRYEDADRTNQPLGILNFIRERNSLGFGSDLLDQRSPDVIPQIASPKLMSEKNRGHHLPGARICYYIVGLSKRSDLFFGSMVSNFIKLTIAGKENDPRTVVQHIRQFMDGMKNYLIHRSESGLGDFIKSEQSKMQPGEFLNMDAIIERALLKCIVKPLHDFIYKLFVQHSRLNGSLEQLSDGIKLARAKSLADLGISEELIARHEASVEIARQFLTLMEKTYSPLKKLENILGAVSVINSAITADSQMNSSYSSTGTTESNDLLCILTYALIQHGLLSGEIEADYTWGLVHRNFLNGEGHYHLATFSSAVNVIKTFQGILKNKNANNIIPSVPSSIDSFLQVVVPNEKQDKLGRYLLPVHPSMLTRDICSLMVHRLKLTNPQDHGLYSLVNGVEQRLKEHDSPLAVHSKSVSDLRDCIFVYRRTNATFVWPRSH